MKTPNYSSTDMAIHAAADLEKALQTPSTESPFQVGDSQFKAIREFDNTNVERKTRSVVKYVMNNITSTALTGQI